MMRTVILILLFCYSKCLAQSFKAETSIADIPADGFYRILISPEVSGHLNNDFTNIRVYDSKGKEVPYLFQQEFPSYYKQQFYEYEILEKKYKKNCCTSLVLRNPSRTPINNINLLVKNAEAWREASLLGSDDRMQWFAVKDRVILNATNNSNATAEIKIVDFPWSNYEFYLLRIDDSTQSPLNIVQAGYYDVHSAIGSYAEVRPLKMMVSDSASEKKTYVRLSFNAPRFIDKLELVISGTKYYRRNAFLSEKRIKKPKKGKPTEYYSPTRNFELTSGRTAVLELPGIRAQEFLIEIENEDNPPLTISEIKAFQLNRYLIAWLKKDDQYKVKFGPYELKAPVYDLAFFKDSIPQQVPALELMGIKILEKPTAESETFFTSKIIIWAAIVAVILVLGVMSVKLVRESEKTEPKS